jgi:hypothetical protein
MLVWGGAAVVKPTLDLLSASSPPVVIRGRCSGLWRWLCRVVAVVVLTV